MVTRPNAISPDHIARMTELQDTLHSETMASRRIKEPGKLDEYRAKRDFAKTPEPSPESSQIGGGKGKKKEFVVQKHDATRLHYDVRLEVDGAMMSFAVPKGPSYDPDVKRLAVETEDHP